MSQLAEMEEHHVNRHGPNLPSGQMTDPEGKAYSLACKPVTSAINPHDGDKNNQASELHGS
ncbi:hypothetical protein [Rhizobium leguminosarum]|uniref:hypothetical protein n=1 Tax=Rhizobium leguminosarum TaxID=384 RepID=UPI000A425437|nr:hypothetical protein [Rhizobium leguminosarum]